jgi:hypothetical protein
MVDVVYDIDMDCRWLEKTPTGWDDGSCERDGCDGCKVDPLDGGAILSREMEKKD